MTDYGIERSFWGVGSNVEFIEDAARQLHSLPVLVGPVESIQVDDLGGTVYPLRLVSGSWVRQVPVAVKLVKILSAGVRGVEDSAMVSVCESFHGKEFTPAAQQVQADGASLGSP